MQKEALEDAWTFRCAPAGSRWHCVESRVGYTLSWDTIPVCQDLVLSHCAQLSCAVVTDGFVVLRALETRKKHCSKELSCCSAQRNPL